MTLPEFVKSREKIFLPATALVLLPITAGLDFFITADFSLSLFYLAPVWLAAWHGGKNTGTAMAVASAAVFCSIEIVRKGFFQSAAYWNSAMLLGFLLGFAMLLAALKQSRANEKNLARNDTVTTAINSSHFYEALQSEIERARRYSRHFTLIYIDLDDFKEVNESYGHKEGDSALWHTVVTIASVLRKTDIIGRLGGDEFGCLLPETGFDASGIVIERLRKALEKEMLVHKWGRTFSMGAVTFAEAPGKPDDAIRMADSLMEQVKRSGKNGVEHKVFC